MGRKGTFEWVVNPSTRPVVQPRTYQELSTTPYSTTQIQGVNPGPGAHTDHEFVLTESVDLWRTDLDWPTPDDLDLEVYRKDGDQLVKVSSSGNFVGDKERVDVTDAAPGTYVLRVINFASATPTYTLTESFFAAETRTTAGQRESYVLTCEKDGKVLQTTEIFIDRGEQKSVDLARCRRLS